MKENRILRYFSFLFTFLIIFSSFTVFASASSVVPENIDTSLVMDDLKRMEAYDADRYDVDETVDYCEIVDLIEYGYDANGSTKNYALYLYIYNPSCKKILVNNSLYSSVQLRAADADEEIAGDGNPWAKYSMTFLNCSSDNLFYKFRIDIPKSFMRMVDQNLRCYEIADVELRFVGDYISRSVGASGKWNYSGYMEYHDPTRVNTVSSLEWVSTVLQTLELELKDASWKTQTSSEGRGYQHELSSVYFAVPDKIIRDYGNTSDPHKGLRTVKGVYENYAIRGISTASDDFYELADQYRESTSNIDDIPFGFMTKPYMSLTSYYSDKTYNIDPFPGQFEIMTSIAHISLAYAKPITKIGNVFHGTTELMTKESFNSQVIEKYNNGTLYKAVGSYPKKTFEINTTDGDLKKQFETFAEANGESWFLYWLTGNPIFVKENIGQIDPIVVVKDGDVAYEPKEVGDKYYICETDAEEFVSYVNENTVGKTTYLMRFAVTDYYCSDIAIAQKGSGNDIAAGNGNFYFEKEIFLNFDILSLTWENKNGVRTVLPVKANPINITGTPSTPVDKDDIFDRFQNTFGGGVDRDLDLGDLKKLLQILLVLVVVILIVVLISKVPGLAKAIGTVIALPFKAVGGLISAVSDASESRERRKKSKAERKEIDSRQADREADRAARKAEKDADREERRQENEARRAERAAERAARKNKNKKEDE